VVIEQLKAVTILPPVEDTIPVPPGKEESITFDITNVGNGDDLVTPGAIVPEGWEVRTLQPSVLLTPGETKTVQMWVTVPPTATAGAHEVTLVATSEGTQLDAAPLSFVVDWLPRLSVAVVGSYDRNLTQGEELTMEFRVTNLGNAADFVNVEIGSLSRGVTAEARPTFRDLAKDEIGTFIIAFTASDDAELLPAKYTVTFIHAEDVERVPVQVNITIELKTVDPGPGDPDDDDDDDGGFPMWMLGAIAAVVIIAVVGVLLFMSTRRRRTDSKMEEAFFKEGGRSERETSAVLEQEMAARRTPPPPPETAPGQAPAPAPAAAPAPAPAAAPPAGRSCPECGNAMDPLGPDGGMYCPMCGHQEGGP
jgi:hypothetical protein